jgi:hypothetical protein
MAILLLRAVLPFAVLALCGTPFAPAREPAQVRVGEFDVSAVKGWIDTGIDIGSGDTLQITASGTLRYPQSKETGPDGLPRGWRDLLRTLPLNEANRGSLIGRIGNGDAARPFLIGQSRQSRAAFAGRLYLGLNQAESERPDGSYHVKIEIAAASRAPKPAPDVPLPALTQAQLDQLPVRVQDAAGNPGDRVNFLILGSEDKVKRAFAAAGWVEANRNIKDAVLGGALTTIARQAYVQMPMSELYLFGRTQDLAYEQAEPLMVVAARHHFRMWKAPFQVDGWTLWAGAGTHDIGFDKDQRTGGVTHKIDPDTDKERDFIGSTLQQTGEVAKTELMTAAGTFKESRTAHGESFYTDGRTLLVVLTPDESDRSRAFAGLFCSVLRERNPDGGEWGDCAQYLESPAAGPVELGPMTTKYRVLIVPGLMNTCFPGAPAFKEGQAYLREKYGMTVDLLALPNDGSDANAARIAEYLRERMKDDERKYIVLGYSKGAPDLQVALAREAGVSSAVAAFISVAGAVGGSPLADLIPGLADRWIRQFNLPNCQGDLTQGLKSLSQPARRAFLTSHPAPVVPTYSIPAVSDESRTSKMLLEGWKLISASGAANDSNVARVDAIVPGSIYLGTALADHFALALPFETSNESLKSGADKNHYPRSALLEALVRFVIRDLEKPR